MGQADSDLLAAGLIGTSVWHNTVCGSLALGLVWCGLGVVGRGVCCASLRSAPWRFGGSDPRLRARSHGDQPRLDGRCIAQCLAGGRDPSRISLCAGWGPTRLAYSSRLRRFGPPRQGPDRPPGTWRRCIAACPDSEALDCAAGLAGGPASLGDSARYRSALVRLAIGRTWPSVRRWFYS